MELAPKFKGPVREEASVAKLDFEELNYLIEGDLEAVTSAVGILKEEVDDLRITGDTKGGYYDSKRGQFTFPLVSAQQKNRIIDALTDLSIFPWEENGLLIIDRERDIEKLHVAGIIVEKAGEISPPILKMEEIVGEKEPEPVVPTTSRANRAALNKAIKGALADRSKRPVPDLYRFPYSNTKKPKKLPAKFHSKKERKVMVVGPYEDVEDTSFTEMDDELRELVNQFDGGNPNVVNEERFRARFGDMPTLSLFPQKYMWLEGELYNRYTGVQVTKDERAEMLKRGAEGDVKASEELVRIHLGLVLVQVAYTREKLGWTEDSDDLLQEGLIALMGAIRLHRPELGALSTYAVINIQARMRKFAYDYRKIIRRPSHTAAQLAAYHKIHEPLEKINKDSSENLSAALHEKEIISEPTAFALDRFERQLFVQSRFDPLDESFGESGGGQEVDMLGEDLVLSHVESDHLKNKRSEQIFKALSTLNARNQLILCMRFGLIPPTPLDKRDLMVGALGFSDNRVEKETNQEILTRGKSMMEDKEARSKEENRLVSGRNRRFIELLERVFVAEKEPITNKELGILKDIERFFLATVGVLNEKQKIGLYDQDFSLEDIGFFYGASRERIRQIEAKALRLLKHPARSGTLRSYFDN